MRFEIQIAKKIISGKTATGRLTAPIIKVAVAGVSLGMAVMILTIAIVTGFQKEIREKATGFGGHIDILPFDLNSSFEKKPVDVSDPELIQSLKEVKGIHHYQMVAPKAGIIKTEEDIEGVVLKGIGLDFDADFFNAHLISGKMISLSGGITSNEVVLSKYTASRLKLNVGDDVVFYFAQNPARIRKLTLSGIYETGFEDMDKLYALCDIQHVQKLNNWSKDQVANVEIFVDDFSKVDEIKNELNSKIGYKIKAQTIVEINPQLFDWLGLQDMNGIILIGLIVIVCAINMISALLILILERTRTIGILKALGSPNGSIRKIFLYIAAYLLFIGMVLGNFVGIALCFVQKNFGVLKLDQRTYYIPEVPIHLEPSHLILLNAATLFICVLLMMLPTAVITRITPVKAIRFS